MNGDLSQTLTALTGANSDLDQVWLICWQEALSACLEDADCRLGATNSVQFVHLPL